MTTMTTQDSGHGQLRVEVGNPSLVFVVNNKGKSFNQSVLCPATAPWEEELPDEHHRDGGLRVAIAVLTVEDNRFYLQPSINQKPGQGSCHFDVSIFAPVKSELESRPSRSQMPSASANDTSRRRTFSGVTNAIEPDHASGAPGR